MSEWTETALLLWQGTLETLLMVVPAALLAQILGLLVGVALALTRPEGLKPQRAIHWALDAVVNAGRSLPFIILLVLLIPLTRLLVGTSIGSKAAIVPLTVAAVPFVARLVDGVLRDVPAGITEAAWVMGASTSQIVWKIWLPESLPALVHSFTVMLVSLISYSAMAGAIGGGGLGDLAIRYGYQRFDMTVMVLTVIVLLIMVQSVQWIGDRVVRSLDHR